ncbi:MAG TPA: ATP-binding protein [Verrucomicrobiae bacterium]|nr:ATP-binding protein [Verrucomicrobiae bacterium]
MSRRLVAESGERRRLEKELKALPNRILAAQESERRRIAAELHDGINQLLASIKFRLAHLDGKVQGEAAELVSQSAELLDRAVREVRRMAKNLRPSALDDFGLVPAMEELVQEFRSHTKAVVEFKRSAMCKRLPPQVEMAIYRIFQQALTNIEQHAKASRVSVSLNVDAKFATLNVIDNGVGFVNEEKEPPDSSDRGLGIINMRERTEALGGVFDLRSAPGKGTEIVVHVKLDTK